jgi:hypothetical protein
MKTLIFTSLVLVAAVVVGGWLIWFSPWAGQRQARHAAAWAGFTDPGPDGLSRFQRESREIVARFGADHELHVDEELVAGEDPYIVSTIGGIGATVHISRDQVDLDSPHRSWRWEYWDASCPADTKRWLSENLEALVHSRGGDTANEDSGL